MTWAADNMGFCASGARRINRQLFAGIGFGSNVTNNIQQQNKQ